MPVDLRKVMDYKDVAAALEELRITTGRLFPALDNLNDLESVIEDRQVAVEHLNRLVISKPDYFSSQDLNEMRCLHARGKRAHELALENRQRGWDVSTAFARDLHVLNSFGGSALADSR